MLEMTQAEYARHRGVTKQAVNKLVKSGKIPVSIDAKGRHTIDAAAADRALGEVRERIIARDEVESRTAPYTPPPEGGGLTKAKTATEVYRARLAQLEYEERVGRLLRTDDVRRSMEICAEVIARDVNRLSARAEDLAAAFTQGGISGMRAALKDIARSILFDLSANMRVRGKNDAQASEGAEAAA